MWPSNTARHPQLSKTFCQSALSSGAIVPPIGEAADIARENALIGWAVVLGAVLLAAAIVLLAVVALGPP